MPVFAMPRMLRELEQRPELARLVDFNKRVGSSGDVGIWHETYLVPAGAYWTGLDVVQEQPDQGLCDRLRQAPVVVEDQRLPVRYGLAPPQSRRLRVSVGVVGLEPQIRGRERIVNMAWTRQPHKSAAHADEGLDEDERARPTHGCEHHGIASRYDFEVV
jgi:hypothetical protein